MDLFTNITLVFISGIVELWLAVPTGIALKLNPILIVVVSASSSILAVLIVAFLGDSIRNRFIAWRYGEDKKFETRRIHDVWNKYGVVGLGLLSPLLFGAPLGTAVGITFGVRKDNLILWMSLGIIIWSVGLTAAGIMGLMSFEALSK
ncbi:small multi-drug export protein [Methanobacterium congolense]|uniref:Small multi-drug export protein n=1 Tax=Methanobacterium congolense TaxID=118062 RepID=A0A1D3L4J6_9EURY|nr:small multi-drug export protein [Methanobacterium congolense]SCG86478.1 putative protein [Methanobacterium congolense]